MSKRTRYFLIGSVAVLVLGLSIGVVAYYNGGLKAITRTGPDELAFVPDNAAVVAYADVKQIMGSNFRQRVKQFEGAKEQGGQQEFRDETGIDIEKDIDSVIGYMAAEDGAKRESGAVIATGRFDPQRISNLVVQKGGTIGKYLDRTLMTLASAEHPNDTAALAFLSDTQVVVGSADAVRRTIDVAAHQSASGDVTGNAKMMGLIGQVDRGTAWVVGRFDALSRQAHLPAQVASQIPAISWFSASTNIDGGVSGQLSVEASDAQAAANLKSVVEGLKGLAALQARSSNVPSQLQEALNSLQISQGGDENKTLTLYFSLPSEMLDALSAMGGGKGVHPGK